MSYKITLGCWGSVFAVPCDIVDKHLRLAGAAAIKTLLYILRHCGEEIESERLSEALGYPQCDIDDAVEYWVSAGLLTDSGAGLTPAEGEYRAVSCSAAASPRVEAQESPKPTRTKRERIRYSYSECVEMMSGDDSLRQMLIVLESILAKQLNHTEIAVFITIVRWYGLPTECVAMLVEHCKETGKTSAAYIEAAAIAWADEEINTVELAQKKIARSNELRSAWGAVRAALDIPERKPTKKETELCDLWINNWHVDIELIKLAYERCVDKKGKMSVGYMGGIINNWHTRGIATAEQAEKDAPVKKSAGESSGRYEPTYDKDEIESMLDSEWLDGIPD